MCALTETELLRDMSIRTSKVKETDTSSAKRNHTKKTGHVHISKDQAPLETELWHEVVGVDNLTSSPCTFCGGLPQARTNQVS